MPHVISKLRDQLHDELRTCVYPFGTVAVTTEADHDIGLELDSSTDATDNWTVHRAYGEGKFDVCIFSDQPRTTLVSFPFDKEMEDMEVGARRE